MSDLKSLFANTGLQVWTNYTVPPNDGGISLGQAALAAFPLKNVTKERVPELEHASPMI